MNETEAKALAFDIGLKELRYHGSPATAQHLEEILELIKKSDNCELCTEIIRTLCTAEKVERLVRPKEHRFILKPVTTIPIDKPTPKNLRSMVDIAFLKNSFCIIEQVNCDAFGFPNKYNIYAADKIE